MAAQKLTKARLVQIIIMMSVLIAAFSYRTITHDVTNTVDCSVNEQCKLKVGEENITFLYHSSTKVLNVTKSELLTFKVQNMDDVLMKSVKQSTIEGVEPPVNITVTSSSGESRQVVIR